MRNKRWSQLGELRFSSAQYSHPKNRLFSGQTNFRFFVSQKVRHFFLHLNFVSRECRFTLSLSLSVRVRFAPSCVVCKPKNDVRDLHKLSMVRIINTVSGKNDVQIFVSFVAMTNRKKKWKKTEAKWFVPIELNVSVRNVSVCRQAAPMPCP